MLIDIRPAEEKDYASIAELITTAEELFLVYPAGRFPFSVEQVAELAIQRRDMTLLTLDHQVIGFANLYNYRARESAFIGNVIIARTYRGKGLGRRLLEYMLNRGFNELALKQINISVFSANAPALLLYTDLGFRPFEIEPRVDFSGQRAALIHMRLDCGELADNGRGTQHH